MFKKIWNHIFLPIVTFNVSYFVAGKVTEKLSRK